MSSSLIDTSSGVPRALKNSPAVLPHDGTAGHRWAVVLAGGDGTRLQSLTLKIAGDQRPKPRMTPEQVASLPEGTLLRADFGVDLLVVEKGPTWITMIDNSAEERQWSDAEGGLRMSTAETDYFWEEVHRIA